MVRILCMNEYTLFRCSLNILNITLIVCMCKLTVQSALHEQTMTQETIVSTWKLVLLFHSSYDKFSQKQTKHNSNDCHDTNRDEADGTRFRSSINRDLIGSA